MGEALIGVELVRHPSPGQILVQFDALGKGGQFVILSMEQTDRRQTLQVKNSRITKIEFG